jgi:hypothetical protein
MEFLRFISTELTERADHPVAVEGARQLASVLADDPPSLSAELSTVGAVDTLAELPSHPLTDALRQVQDQLPWTPSSRVDDAGANVGLALLSDCIDLAPLNVGLMLVGPDGAYPEHHHSPSEVYLVLGGEAQWRFGGSDEFRVRRCGDIVYNHSNDRHQLHTNDQSTVAMWVLYDRA